MGKRIAIECTTDYADTNFHSDLIDTDVQNEDGTYGKVIERYRLVEIDSENNLKAYDDNMFDSHTDVQEYITKISSIADIEVITYDELLTIKFDNYLKNIYEQVKRDQAEADKVLKDIYDPEKEKLKEQELKEHPENAPEVKSKLNLKKEEYIQKKKDQVNEINEDIKNILDNFKRSPERMKELFEFAAGFYKYSAKNTMLIMEQNRGATFVQSFDKWKEDGYHVLKGQRGLKVFVPVKATYVGLKNSNDDTLVKLSVASKQLKDMYYKHDSNLTVVQKTHYQIGHVFDISQTDCPKENYPKYFSMGYSDEKQDALINGIINCCEQDLNIPVKIDALNSISLRGFFNPVDNSITLNDKLNSSEELSTLSHELGHAVMEHGISVSETDTSICEFEADCFSIMMDKHLGIEATESRQSHIVNAFNSFIDGKKEDENFSLDKIIDNVCKKFKATVEVLDKHLDKQIELQHEAEQTLDNAQLNEPIEIACYQYEHNSGDQSWRDYTTYYKNTDNTYTKIFENGYSGSSKELIVTKKEIQEDMQKIQKDCSGDYSILKKLPHEYTNAETVIDQHNIEYDPSIMNQTADYINSLGAEHDFNDQLANVKSLSIEEKNSLIDGVEFAIDNGFEVEPKDYDLYLQLIAEKGNQVLTNECLQISVNTKNSSYLLEKKNGHITICGGNQFVNPEEIENMPALMIGQPLIAKTLSGQHLKTSNIQAIHSINIDLQTAQNLNNTSEIMKKTASFPNAFITQPAEQYQNISLDSGFEM